MSEAGRSVEVDAARLIRWCDGFAARHGSRVPGGEVLAPNLAPNLAPSQAPNLADSDVVVARVGDCLILTGPDGATARLHPPFPWPAGVNDVPTGARFLLDIDRCAVLLVRRGGYACAVVRGDRVESSKVGTRYVQGRTAAGGWSQQRFARRRDNQTQDLVSTAADVAVRILLPAGNGAQNSPGKSPGNGPRNSPRSSPGERVDDGYSWLVTGGDSALVAKVLLDPRLGLLAELRRGPHLAIGDPRSDVVRAVPEQMRRVRIHMIP